MTVDLAGLDATSLERLHDLVVPPPVPWWPPAPGWLWLLCFAALFALWRLLRGFGRWQRNRYRREALAELGRLEALANANRAEALAGMAALLKRTAITAYGREPVAALTGTEWFSFLDGCCDTRFTRGLGAAMEDAIFRPGRRDPPLNPSELADEVRKWVRSHERASSALPMSSDSDVPSAPVGERKAA